jgi:hypothetical protein
MGILDDAIREHLELKRRLGASEEELQEKETEAFGAGGAAAPARAVEPPATEEEPEFQVQRATPVEDRAQAEDRTEAIDDPWAPAGSDEDLLESDEVLPQDSLEPNGAYAPPPPREGESMTTEPGAEEPHEDPLDEWEEEPPPPTEDVLRETPEFLEETPEHDRLWFEQKPPKDFDLD